MTIFGCSHNGNKKDGSQSNPGDALTFDSTSVDFPFEKILERGSIRVILANTSTGYFLYKGRPMGFHYELARDFSDLHGLSLDIIIENDFERSFQMLLKGKADIIAHALTMTMERRRIINFMDPLYEVRQMLIQRKPEDWRNLKKHEIEEELIKSPTELVNQVVHVKKGSSYFYRLKNLSNEIGGEIEIRQDSGEVTTEELITMVAEKKISYTMADEDLANVGTSYYDDLDASTPLSLPTPVGWAIRKNSPGLQKELNLWIGELKRKPDFNVLVKRYFEDPKGLKKRVNSDYSSVAGDKISPYDQIIKKYAREIQWDWKLLAALVYQESEFDPAAESWMGARGLMQLVPTTAEEFGARDILDPEQNIRAGTRYIQWLQDYWREYIRDPEELRKFVLASYNAGQAHVMDAIKLTEKYGRDPQVWEDNVAYFLSLKSNPKYFNDPVVEAGYCRGQQPVDYVKSILEQYSIYTQFFS